MRTPPSKTPLTIITFEDDVSPLAVDDNLISNYKDWLFVDPVHNKTPMTVTAASASSHSDENFDWADYDENPFGFNLFGRGVWGRKVRAIVTGKSPCQSTEQASKAFDPHSVEELERVQLRRLYYIALVKVNLKLGVVAKLLEFATIGVIGLRYAMTAWVSLAIQLILTTLSSTTQLWRYNGKYSLPEETFDRELYDKACMRERKCCGIHGIWKMCSAGCLIAFSVRALHSGQSLRVDQLEDFQRMTYLGAGFCTGGFVSRISLNVWITYMSCKGLGLSASQSLSAESVFSYIVAAASLKTAVLCFVMVYKPLDVLLVSKVLEVNALVDAGLGTVSAAFGLKDLYGALPPPKKT